eukprot:6302051-Ditylum_brightwellii.AAC.1
MFEQSAIMAYLSIKSDIHYCYSTMEVMGMKLLNSTNGNFWCNSTYVESLLQHIKLKWEQNPKRDSEIIRGTWKGKLLGVW